MTNPNLEDELSSDAFIAVSQVGLPIFIFRKVRNGRTTVQDNKMLFNEKRSELGHAQSSCICVYFFYVSESFVYFFIPQDEIVIFHYFVS